MTKNYFTDEQVKEAVKVSLPWSKNMQLSIPQLAEFKALMNLAVESAIGDPVAYCRDDTVLNWKGQSVNIANMFPSPKGLLNPTPLYSVKELEN